VPHDLAEAGPALLLGDGRGLFDLVADGLLGGGAYYVVERGDDQTISDQSADRLYSGALSNEGERLRLLDPSGAEIDVVNPSGGDWPAGNTSARDSMERIHGLWRTFSGFYGLGLDADGRPVAERRTGPLVLFPTPPDVDTGASGRQRSPDLSATTGKAPAASRPMTSSLKS
jgi:hypothetical protein